VPARVGAAVVGDIVVGDIVVAVGELVVGESVGEAAGAARVIYNTSQVTPYCTTKIRF